VRDSATGASAGYTLVALIAAWVAIASPFLLHPVAAGGVLILAGATAIWLWVSALTWVNWNTALVAFTLGVLVVGQLTFRPLGPFTLSDFFFFASLAVVSASLLARRRRLVLGPSPLLLVPAAMVLLGGGVAVTVANTPADVVGATARFVFVLVVLPWLALQVLTSERSVLAAMMAWAVSAAANGIAALAQVADNDVIPGTTASWGRMTGFAQHVNELGAISAVALVPAVALAIVLAPLGLKRSAWLLPALVTLGLILSLSLSGMFAVVGGVLLVGLLLGRAVLVRARRSRGRVAVAATALGVVILALAVLPSVAGAPSVIDRVTAAFDPDSPHGRGTVWTRWRSIKNGWAVIEEDALFGVGADPDKLTVGPDQALIHNTALATWAAIGLIAMIGVVAAFTAALILIARTPRRAPPSLRPAAYALFAGFAAYSAFALVSPALYRRFGWVALSFAVVIERLGNARPVAPETDGAGGVEPARAEATTLPAVRASTPTRLD
jgi:O-antigen ligase